MKPLGSRLEAIQKSQPLSKMKGYRNFVGMVNFLSIFCPELQKLLKQIYDLTRKSRPFVWGKEQQDLFEEIKHRLIKPPVLHMPNTAGDFSYILTPVNLLLEVHYTKYRMANPSSLHMPANDYQKPQEIIPSQNWSCVDKLSI